MPSSGIIIPIRAIADLSGVSTAFNRLFGGSNSRALRDYQRDMDRLRQSLSATGQLGKNISRVMFDPSANRAELQTLTRIRQELEAIARTKQGRQWRASVIGSGQDWNKPWEWDYGRMGAHGAALQQRMAHGGMGPGMSPWRSLGSWGARSAMRGFGAMSGLAGIATTTAGLAYAGYQEHKGTVEGVDSIFKALGSSAGFQGLMDDVRQFGKELQLAGSEASHLAAQFVRASGASNTGDALTRGSEAGQFGRGYGMAPGSSAELFARSSLVGYGNNRQTQRDFAATMATTIAGSGMFSRSEQVMGDLVGKIEDIATNEGRTASTGEVGNFAAMLREMFKDPALRGGGANTLLSIGESLGGEGGPAMEAFAYAAYGSAVGNRMEDVKRIQQANPYTPIGEIAGIGEVSDEAFSKTRAELAVAEIRRQARDAGMSEEYMANQFYNTPGGMQQYRQYADYVDRSVRYRNDTGYQNWMANEVGTSTDLANPSGLGITTDIYEHRGSTERDHMQRLAGYANEYLDASNTQLSGHEELRDQLRAAMQDGGDAATRLPQLQEVLAKIAAQVGGPQTDADRERQAKANLLSTLGSLGDSVALLTTVISDLLVPPLKIIADLLKSIIDLFRPGSNNTLIDRTMRGLDDQLMQSMKDNGMVDENDQPTASMDAGHRRTYESIMRHRRENPANDAANPNAPAGSSGGPDSSNPTGHTPDWMRNAENNGVSGSITPGRRALLDMVGRAESNGKYNAMYKSANQTQIDLTNMSMGDIDALQTRMIRERGGSVIGKYQFKQETLRGLRAEQGIGDDEKFDKAMQDRLGLALLKRRGLDEWEAGTLPDADFKRNLGHEWAGLPVDASGRSAYQGYNGNAATISNAEVDATLEAARTANNALPAAPPGSEPAVPATLADVDDEIPAVPANVDTETPAVPVADVPSAAPTVGNGPLTEDEFQARYVARERERQAQQGEMGRGGTQVDGVGSGSNWDDVARMRPRNPLDTAQPPRTPPEVATPAGSTQASAASVNGSVAVNINVAKDGRPVETSAHQLSFGGQPQVAGSAGSQPSRVEWSRTV